MTITRLDPPIPMYVPGKGKGWAHFLVNYGIESHNHWIIFMDETSEIWELDNTKVRAQKNITMGRTL